jgi:N-acetyltransferase
MNTTVEPFVKPVILHGHGITLLPLAVEHEAALRAAAADGELWKLRFTSVPEPDQTRAYIERALKSREAGDRFAFAVKDEVSGRIIGVTSYHDIIPTARRVEIGWTWYAKSFHRTHVNTACKWRMMSHACEVLNCTVVGWRTDNVNFASQRAIERLGAKKDGVIRSHFVRRDGTIRDTVMYSVTEQEWRYGIKAHLQWLLAREH